MTEERIFIDTSILILASKAIESEVRDKAIAELDRDVTFLSSRIVRLETIPQPTLNNRPEQVGFLEDFFAGSEMIECTDVIQRLALLEACKSPGQTAADALHIACAIAGAATEIVCAEKSTSTMPQYKGQIPVRTVF